MILGYVRLKEKGYRKGSKESRTEGEKTGLRGEG
jgi:hypothetical protein